MKTSKFAYLGLAVLLTACENKGNEYDASGIFETTEVIVSAKSNGEIKEFNLEEGQQVAQAETIGYIDTTQLFLKKKQLIANLQSTESQLLDKDQQLATLRQQIAIQKREQSRYEKLVKADAANRKQLDDILYQIEVLEKELAATAEKLLSSNSSISNQSASLRAQTAQIDDQIKNALIVSPVSGTILTKYAEPGEYATPGKALFKVGAIENMKLRAYLTADQLTGLQLGQAVKVYADQGKSDRKEYAGILIWISDQAEFTPKTIQTRDERSNLVYAIKVAVKNDGYIKRGMYGEIKF